MTSTTQCVDKQVALSPLPTHTNNGEIIYSTHTALLPNQDLPLEARRCHIFPGPNKSLSSIGVIFNHGFIAYFDYNTFSITNKTTNRVIMKGGRNLQTGLYTLDILATSIHPKRMTEIPFLECFCANNANKCKSKQDQILYYHHACFFPTQT